MVQRYHRQRLRAVVQGLRQTQGTHCISTSLVTRHTSHVTRHTSHVARHASHFTRHTSHVTRHTSHVTLHTSHVTRHTGHRHIFLLPCNRRIPGCAADMCRFDLSLSSHHHLQSQSNRITSTTPCSSPVIIPASHPPPSSLPPQAILFTSKPKVPIDSLSRASCASWPGLWRCR
jgi:hypothetical protein